MENQSLIQYLQIFKFRQIAKVVYLNEQILNLDVKIYRNLKSDSCSTFIHNDRETQLVTRTQN